jgi:hypothetical protein
MRVAGDRRGGLTAPVVRLFLCAARGNIGGAPLLAAH